MSQSYGTDRDYPVVDRADRDPDGTEADPAVEAEFRAGQHDGPPPVTTTILPATPEQDLDPDGGAHRKDTPVDAGPEERGLAGGRPGEPVGATAVPPVTDDTASVATGPAVVRSVDTDTDTHADTHADTDVDTAGRGVPVAPGTDASHETAAESAATLAHAPDTAPAAAPALAKDDAWYDLQGLFVDDPQAAVREAAQLLERAVAELRSSLEGSDSTEELRTAFRRYRDVYRSLR